MNKIQLKNIICVLLIAALLPFAAFASENQEQDEEYNEQTFSEEELAQMLAPIALYPDALLSQILMAATYPFEVVEAERWVTKNPYVKGKDLDEALQAKDWDVSVLALCHYPKVLTMLAENLSWTARIGDAFANQEEDVMDTIQDLRARARAAGNLATTPEQKIIIEGGYIHIEPAGPDYIYVPAYDPQVVYGHWWLPLFPPFPILLPGLVVTGPGIIFSPRFSVGFGVFGWSSFNWGARNIVIVDIDRTRRFNRHVHRYRIPDREHWRPDHDRRFVREKRAGEIPRFVPPVRTRPEVRSWERKTSPDLRTPEQRKPSSDRPRGFEKDKRPRWNKPGAEKSKSPDAGAARMPDQKRPADQDRRGMDQDKSAGKPRILDGGNRKVPEQGMNRPPVVRDRGKAQGDEPRRQAPVFEQKGAAGDQKTRERGGQGSFRVEPREDRGDRPERSKERWGDRSEQPQRGGMNREQGERRR